MALIYEVVYPGGERARAVGYPDGVLRVTVVPRGPEACLGDLLECTFGPAGDYTAYVRAVVGGPRRPTRHVRVDGDRAAWIEAREREGLEVLEDPDDPAVVWVVD